MTLIEKVLGLEDLRVEGKKNVVTSFLPFRKGGKEFEYGAVGGSVLCSLVGQRPRKGFSLEAFKATCLDTLKHRLSDSHVVDDLQRMYFDNDALLNRSPRFLLLKGATGENASTRHLTEIFCGFLSPDSSATFEGSATFIEKLFISALDQNLESKRREAKENPYLPFVAEYFNRDLMFLVGNPDYLMANFEPFFELYNVIYCTQLALNITHWKTGSLPAVRPLYFLLDNERFSSERTQLKNGGFAQLERSIARLFPLLSVLEYFNDGEKSPAEPLWAFVAALLNADAQQQAAATMAIRHFSTRYREDRKVSAISGTGLTVVDELDVLFHYAESQFSEGTTKERVNQQYGEVFEKTVAQNFIQTRGRAGKVLVMNQDFVLLLTNLAIGNRTRLRFQEVMKGFQNRGFYFDKQSQQALISFFERVGNVERLSDSGDAVYVRSTI